MKVNRHAKIIELINKYHIETQEELAEYLNQEGFKVTQATVSRDIRDLKLTKIPSENGKQRYALHQHNENGMSEKYIRVLREGYLSMDMAQNILVIKTVAGMASAVCAALDAMKWNEIVGSIAGDDTIMCAIRSVDDTVKVMDKISKIIFAIPNCTAKSNHSRLGQSCSWRKIHERHSSPGSEIRIGGADIFSGK